MERETRLRGLLDEYEAALISAAEHKRTMTCTGWEIEAREAALMETVTGSNETQRKAALQGLIARDKVSGGMLDLRQKKEEAVLNYAKAEARGKRLYQELELERALMALDGRTHAP